MRGSVVSEHEVRHPQVPVGDAVLMEVRHQIPDLAKQPVADLGSCDAIERSAGNRLIREHYPVAAHIDQKSRRRDFPVPRLQRRKRFVLDRATERDEGPAVTRMTKTQPAIYPVHEIRSPVIRRKHFDEYRATVRSLPKPGS